MKSSEDQLMQYFEDEEEAGSDEEVDDLDLNDNLTSDVNGQQQQQQQQQ